MAEQVSILFPLGVEDGATTPHHNTGILPAQELRRLVRENVLFSTADPISDDQIQPASMDLRLGAKAYRVRASFLPNPNSRVDDKIQGLSTHEVDLTEGAVLEKGCVYIIPLLESVRFTKRMFGFANPKSSTGRLDIFTRLITDHAVVFDQVPEGYKGQLYAEVSPRTFGVVVRKGSKLLQLRVRLGSPHVSDTGIRRLHEEVPLVHMTDASDDVEKMRISGGLAITVDLKGDADSRLVGYKAKPHTDLVDVDNVGGYDALDYWDPIEANRAGTLILDPDAFYILASKEAVTIPPDHAAEMIPFNPMQGEFRVHYAGFFDPGFGHAGAGGQGTRAVLEVRSYEVPFVLDHGQIVARLIYERLTQEPDRLYGRDIGSSYQKQGLALSKHFYR
ncbi:MAG: 2'-deoxycytidine 5'-triphosphate deaminase [Proteobacteria bacterium]|nr:2'-deoxycytidine 5'-triphosphate deaminase [Pseudomonadota bacterium]